MIFLGRFYHHMLNFQHLQYCCCCCWLHCCPYLIMFSLQSTGEEKIHCHRFNALWHHSPRRIRSLFPWWLSPNVHHSFSPIHHVGDTCCKCPFMFSEGPSAGVKHPVIVPKQLLSVFPQSAVEQKDPQGIHFHFIIQVLFTQIVLINVWVTLMSILCWAYCI